MMMMMMMMMMMILIICSFGLRLILAYSVDGPINGYLGGGRRWRLIIASPEPCAPLS